MSDELLFDPTNESDDDAEQDFEEICSDEVDRIVESLEELAASTDSENIRYFLDEAADRIYELVYGEDDKALAEDELPREEAA